MGEICSVWQDWDVLAGPPATASLITPPCCREQSTRIWQTAHLAPSSVTFRNEAPCLVALDYANIALHLTMPTSDPNHRAKQNSTLNCCCLFFRRKCLSGMKIEHMRNLRTESSMELTRMGHRHWVLPSLFQYYYLSGNFCLRLAVIIIWKRD